MAHDILTLAPVCLHTCSARGRRSGRLDATSKEFAGAHYNSSVLSIKFW